MKTGSAKSVRCAIYTRVSTDQGLEQDFNSLDAQYDASQAYIRSQAHAGWSGSRPTWLSICREVRTILLMLSIMCTGTRMVRDWSASERLTACRIHQVA